MYKGTTLRNIFTLHSEQARAAELPDTMEGRTWGLLIMVCAWGVLALVAGASPPADSLRFFANRTAWGRQWACSEAEQRCVRRGLLLHEADGECYAAGARGPCAHGDIFHADKAEATRRGGHLRGTCANPCGDAQRRPVAATGECLTREQVHDTICRRDWYMRPAMDTFGEWVCEWTELLCPSRGGVNFHGNYEPPYDGVCSVLNAFNVISDGPNATVAAERPADHPMLRYFTDKSYLEHEFPCTEAEKECLQYGRLLQSDGKCYVPGQWSRRCEPGQMFHIDWNEMVSSGRLQGTCRSPCGAFKYPQVGTGTCVDFSSMTKICRWDWGLHHEQNEFGQMGCSCGYNPSAPRPPPPTPPAPASAPGLCRAPDFSNPVRTPNYDRTLILGFLVPCSEEEFACLREGRVLAQGACHALRTQGPCAEGEELLLDKHALAHARLHAVCKPRPCPEGSVRLPYDGRCLTYEQVESILCVGQHVALDEFGGWQCDYESNFPGNLTRVTRDAAAGTCELPDKYPAAPFAAAGGAALGGSSSESGPGGAGFGGAAGGGFAAGGPPPPGVGGGFAAGGPPPPGGAGGFATH